MFSEKKRQDYSDRLLGEGGQGTVYRGFHPELGRDVVLKVSRRAVQPGATDALRAEARVLASLDHPGLARVHDFDTYAGQPFAVLEFVDGRTLDAVAAAEPMDPARAAELVAEAARAVAYANQRGIIHRDLKPQNVMLDSTGRVRVIDFGLAHLFASANPDSVTDGSISGTLQYMAPEQARGENKSLGPRADVFGLGGVLYFLLTGAPPYEGGTKLDLLTRAGRGEWNREKLNAAHIPARLRDVCAKALSLNAADRYTTAGAFADALRAAVAPPRSRVLVASIAVAALVALAIGGWAATRKPTAPIVPTPVPDAGVQVAPDPIPAQPTLAALVWNVDQGKYRDAIREIPLATGQKLRYEADAPANRHLALFALEPTGEVHALTTSLPRAEPGKIGYPANPQESSPLTPPKGTVVVLLCGRASAPVSADEVRAALGTDPWPVLPRRTLLMIEREKVDVFGGRGIGPPEGQPNPEGDAIRRLDAGRAKLKTSYDVLAGTAFSFK